MPEVYRWYDELTDEEREIDANSVEALARVLREITEVETDHDHINSALSDFLTLNEMLYNGPVWPETSASKDDILLAIEVAEELSIEYLPENIRKMSQYYNSNLPSPLFTTKIVDSSGDKVAQEKAPGIDGANILLDYDVQLKSVDWDTLTAVYEKT